MQKKLPVRANLEHLKAQAKDLLEAFRRQDAAAIERFRTSLPAARGHNAGEIATLSLALHDAQSVIAREYGFERWASLRAHVQAAGETLSAETLRTLMSSPLPREVEQALVRAISSEMRDPVALASALPLLPLRNAVLSVGSFAPLSIGRPTSLAAVATARKRGDMVAVFAQKDDTNEEPTDQDLHPVGCAARRTGCSRARNVGRGARSGMDSARCHRGHGRVPHGTCDTFFDPRWRRCDAGDRARGGPSRTRDEIGRSSAAGRAVAENGRSNEPARARRCHDCESSMFRAGQGALRQRADPCRATRVRAVADRTRRLNRCTMRA
jgi:hypothetical protein